MRTSHVSVCALSVVAVCFALAAFVGSPVSAEPGDVLDVPIQVSPHTIILDKDNGGNVTVHADISYSCVDTASLYLNGIESLFAFADARGDLVVKFRMAEIQAICTPPTTALTLTGATKDDTDFTGTDVVQVKE